MNHAGDRDQEYSPWPAQSPRDSAEGLGVHQKNLCRPLEKSDKHKLFEKMWAASTEDNNTTLYGFRRFKTTHLLNLRLLEEEIDQMDHRIYQAGLNLGLNLTASDRLGLKHSIRDNRSLRPEDVLDEQLVHTLRDLIRQYGWKSYFMEDRNI